MTTSITAVFEAGLLRPTTPLELAEGTRVELILISDRRNGKQAGRSAASILAEIAALPTGGEPRSPLTIGDLNAFLRSLPSLGDDADDFAKDVRAVRAEFPAEANPWD